VAFPKKIIAEALADLASGLSQREAGRRHGVSHTQVQRWAKMLPECAERVPAVHEALSRYFEEALEARLAAELALYEFLQDPDNGPAYLKDQRIGDIARSLGIFADKDVIASLAVERFQPAADTASADYPVSGAARK